MECFDLDQYLGSSCPLEALKLYQFLNAGSIEGEVGSNFHGVFLQALSKEMIELGLAAERIHQIMSLLLDPILVPASGSQAHLGSVAISPLHAAIIQSLRLNSPASILVFPGSEILIWIDSLAHTYCQEELNLVRNKSHFSVSISGILQAFLKSPGSVFSDPAFSKPQQHIISLLQSQDYDQLTINFKKGVIHSAEITQRHCPSAKLSEILQSHDFQQLTAKRHRGKTSYITSRRKIHFE